MHIPGHNPYLEEIFVDPFFGSGYQSLIQDQPLQDQQATANALQQMMAAFNEYYGNNPYQTYGYEGLGGTVMGALGNVFGEHEGWDLGVHLDAIHDLWASDYDSGHVTFEGGVPAVVLDHEAIDIGEFEHAGSDTDPAFYGAGLSGVNVFDPESIAETLSQMHFGGDYDPNDPLQSIRTGEVKALTPEMIEKTTGAYYSPYEEAERADLVEKKGKALSGASTGGFAGSAGRQSGLSGAERLYQGGYGDLLAEIEKMKGQSTEDVLDTIYGWQELMSSQ
jgi:hypothetical protein